MKSRQNKKTCYYYTTIAEDLWSQKTISDRQRHQPLDNASVLLTCLVPKPWVGRQFPWSDDGDNGSAGSEQRTNTNPSYICQASWTVTIISSRATRNGTNSVTKLLLSCETISRCIKHNLGRTGQMMARSTHGHTVGNTKPTAFRQMWGLL
jgi:hypothetical protein